LLFEKAITWQDLHFCGEEAVWLVFLTLHGKMFFGYYVATFFKEN